MGISFSSNQQSQDSGRGAGEEGLSKTSSPAIICKVETPEHPGEHQGAWCFGAGFGHPVFLTTHNSLDLNYQTTVEEEKIFCTLQGCFGWSKTGTDRRQMKRRKSNLIT